MGAEPGVPFFVRTQKLIRKTLWKNNVLGRIIVLSSSGKNNHHLWREGFQQAGS